MLTVGKAGKEALGGGGGRQQADGKGLTPDTSWGVQVIALYYYLDFQLEISIRVLMKINDVDGALIFTANIHFLINWLIPWNKID